MHLPTDAPIPDTPAQRKTDRARLTRALNASLAFVLALAAVYAAQGSFDIRPFTVSPWTAAGLLGLLTAPLLHGSIEHLAANATSLLLLGTLAGAVYPKATLRALPVVWLGSGLGAWLLGEPGSHHLGASGLTHGLMFLVMTLGLLRRDRPSIAAAMIAFLLYGGMLLTVLPREAGVSWQAHLGGAVAGVASAFAFRLRDPLPPRKRYSWEDEEDAELVPVNDELEPPSPRNVPVLWNRPDPGDVHSGVVLEFPRRDPPAGPQ
ncbi:rhomboid family intramembrane serine protease [Lysobacter yananisis]|uniref:Rhomboid family intramembrane serine protease n=1 Tax=Lysobacter yananisis TaxID=1003114 RepID=A0ABY9PE08_9GAMM|nr:rhomboid family intramembrane serine protease [Lysobacter yananisis]WMT04633.1 rhomboid family intramembrane serine protease [Lysobacter yananisis]